MYRWGIKYGKYWAIQWMFDYWISFGVHLDLKQRIDKYNRKFGPYIDIHCGCIIMSFGYQPAYSGELERCLSISRGGVPD